MAPTQTSGSTVTTDGTEQTLYTGSTAGTYQLYVSLNNMAISDEIELRLKIKTLSTSTSRVLWFQPFRHAQGADAAIAVSPPIAVVHEIAITITRTAGTDRSYEWSLVNYG